MTAHRAVAVATYVGFHGAALAVLVVAAVATIAWLGFFAVLWFRSVPRLPHAGPETSDLGPEPPAVANLVVNGWDVTAAAVPATVVDLAARKVFGLEEVGPDRFVVRTHPRADGSDLTEYEQLVRRLVESRATGGSAPVDALRLGTEESAGWLARFSGAVVKDAEARGLARRGWQRVELVVLGAGLAFALGMVALALTLAHVGDGRGSSGTHDHGGVWFALAAVTWIAAIGTSGRIRSVRATPAGRAACARWLGVRAYLRRNESFREQPPAAVAVWGRVLAYGVALGVNRASTAALPIGPDDPDHAWSRERGAWQRLRVRHPHRFGAGEAPRAVLRSGLLRLVLWGAVAVVALPLVAPVWGAIQDAIAHGDNLAVVGFFVVFFAVPIIGLVFVGARLVDASVRVWRGARDLRRTQVVEGPVVKVSGGSFAVDDGIARVLVAMRAPLGRVPALGQRVRVRCTPALHHVEALTVLDRTPTIHPPSSEERTDGIVQTASTDRDVGQ